MPVTTKKKRNKTHRKKTLQQLEKADDTTEDDGWILNIECYLKTFKKKIVRVGNVAQW